MRLSVITILLMLCQFVVAQKKWTDDELSCANTASEIPILTQEERSVFLYCNLARMYPKRFAEIEVDHHSNSKYVESLLETLNTMEPVEPLLFNQEMTTYAKCWAIVSGNGGLTGHKRTNCSKIPPPYGENCSYGEYTGRDIVMQLLVDEGVEGTGHRLNILDPEWSILGVYIAKHIVHGHCCVMDFSNADQFTASVYSGSVKSYLQPYSPTVTDSRRYRFYEHSGRRFRAAVNFGYLYCPSSQSSILNAGLFEFRHRMFGMSLLSAEMCISGERQWLGYKPAFKIYFPLGRRAALVANMEATADISIFEHIAEKDYEYILEAGDDFFISGCGGLSLHITALKYMPFEFKVEYRRDIINDGPANGILMGAQFYLGWISR